MATTLDTETLAPSAPSSFVETEEQPSPRRRRRRTATIAIWTVALGAVVAVAALTAAVIGDDGSSPSGAVFTEHARLHVADSVSPARPGATFTENARLHVADSASPLPPGAPFTENARLHTESAASSPDSVFTEHLSMHTAD
jgi:hypothetical protein